MYIKIDKSKKWFEMDALIIKSQNASDLKLIKELVKKLGLESKSLSEEEIEDLGLTILMKQADRTKTVSRQSVMEKLAAKWPLFFLRSLAKILTN